MVLITDDRDGGGSSSVRVKQLQLQQQKVHPTITEEPNSEDCAGSYDEDEEEDEEDEDEFEEVDFEDLEDDCRSIASDDSFYPPDDAFADSERSPSPESPQPLSFFQACCSNNATIVRLMIRHGVKEEDVREKDRNNRVRSTQQEQPEQLLASRWSLNIQGVRTLIEAQNYSLGKVTTTVKSSLRGSRWKDR